MVSRLVLLRRRNESLGLAPLLVHGPRLGKELLVLLLENLAGQRVDESLKAARSSGPLLGPKLETNRNRSILALQELHIVIQSESAKSVQGVDGVNHVEVGSDHVAAVVLVVFGESPAAGASALQLLQHAADDVLEASLGDQAHVVGQEDHVLRLGRDYVVVVDDVGNVW